jgi:hypothetical protein
MFPFENIDIKDNCKIIGMHNRAPNQSLERLIKSFAGRGSPSKLFVRHWTRQRGYNQILSVK